MSRQRQQLVERNGSETAWSWDQCLHELFEAQVEKKPDAVSLVFEDQQLTYCELNRRANQLARQLRKLGVGPDELVAICMGRSPEMVIGLLSILKAGGAYVPLDPTYPPDRLAFMQTDAQAKVLLTQANLVGRLAEPAQCVICVDRDWENIAQNSSENLPHAVDGDHLAYMIYTSGSTGYPKGAMNVQRAISNRLGWMQAAYHLTAEDVVLHKTPFSFDVSVWEFFWPLTTGARLVVARPGGHQESKYLVDVICERAVTTVHFVPSMLQMFVQEPSLKQCATLRRVICSGEVLPFALQQRFFQCCGAELHNLYGPTEAAVDVTYWACRRDDHCGPVPIGRPITNIQVYVLDDTLHPVQVGMPGELHIGGAGLGRGYWGRPDLTADKFIPNPFASEAGGNLGTRLYKTGDQARLRPDGSIEFIGRLDDQIKLRGFRIELGEIEAILDQQPGVSKGVIVVQNVGCNPGDERLVACIVPSSPSAPSRRNLRRALQKQLPEYMVPSAFLFLDAWPLTPSGKINRRALPVPEWLRPELEVDLVPPRTPLEQQLAEVWSHVLGISQVGVHDNFFELGGHSLLAMQVLSCIRSALQVELPVRTLFESPTIAGLGVQVEEAIRAGQSQLAPPILPVAREDNLPLSFAQQRLWFLEQFGVEKGLYNLPVSLHLMGPLDVKSLKKSLSEIVRRHQPLRTVFATTDGKPYQVIAQAKPVHLSVEDLQEWSADERESKAQQIMRAEARLPFDLVNGPLMRMRLLRLGLHTHVLLLTMHHIASDGWSIVVLMRELQALYEAFSCGKPSPLPELPIRYADFALWQRQWLQGKVLERQLDYWKRQLEGLAGSLALPLDHPRPSVQTFRGARQSFAVPRPLTEALAALGREEKATLFMVTLAAFQVLLHRYTGQSDIAVGSPLANRNRAEIEGLVGFFVNTLVMRANLSDDPKFRKLVGQVRQMTLGAYEHQDLPFERLVEELQPARDLSRSPLFQVMFVFENKTMLADPPGLSWMWKERENGTAKFDLTLFLTETAQGLEGAWEYNTDLFDAETISRMSGHFQCLLGGIIACPEARASELPLLMESERHQLLIEWNDTKAGYPQEHCIHKLFEAQVERTPDAVAVAFSAGRPGPEDQHLTYRELDRRANQLAHYLQAMGVVPDVPVALCLERSVDMVVGIFGILKAGGAYVPLDPEYPPERLAFMLKDAQPAILLSQQQWVSRLPSLAARVVCLDTEWARVAQSSTTSPKTAVMPDHLAYLIYTSGSTGRPKAVMIQHRSVLNLWVGLRQAVYAQCHELALRVSLNGPLSFDTSVKQLIQLLSGYTLHIVPSEVRLNPGALLQFICSQALDVLDCTPSQLRLLVQEEQWKKTPLLWVLVGGEPIEDGLWQALARVSNIRSYNVYGPTECTVDTTLCPVHMSPRPTIGRPIANAHVYVLDRCLTPAPIGVPGELYIGGAGLARGYLHQPDLTAAAFIPHPFSKEPGARLYRTGDWARYRADGNLEFLGRQDDQIKVHGYRVELGEVEAALAQHPAVRSAVVIACDGQPGGKRLIAYVVGDDGQALSVGALRSFLRDRLPEHMIPSAFSGLDALPLTPSGKVDRRMLPAPDWARPELATDWVAPRTPIEEVVAGIWIQVLDLERVGVADDFFELGGHSLLAAQIISRVRRILQVELPVRALFEAPTVAALSERIQTACKVGGRPSPPIRPVVRQAPPPLSFAQQQLWLVDQLNPDNIAYNLSFPVRLSGLLNVPALRSSLDEIVRRHESLRTTVASEKEQLVQNIASVLSLPLPVVDLSSLSKTERMTIWQAWAREQARRPFDLSMGPLVRVTLLRLEETEHILLLTMHHIITDGWSMNVFFRELALLYRAMTSGDPSPLPDLHIQYADFALWQRAWLQGETLEMQLAYWKQQLNGAPRLLALPTDRPRLPVQTFRGACQSFTLSRPLTDALKMSSRQQSASLFMMLLTAFEVLLLGYTGQTDIVIGTSAANRMWPEVEGLIGYFVNPLALRTNLAGNPTFLELLRRVRETALGAYMYSELPFEKLVEALEPERNLSYNPIFQVMFTCQSAPAAIPALPDLTMAAVELDSGTALFDLELVITDMEQGLAGQIEYSTDLFDGATIARMASHYQALLESIVADPTQTLLALLPAVERVPPKWQPEVADALDRIALRQAKLAERRAQLTAGERAWLEQYLGVNDQ